MKWYNVYYRERFVSTTPFEDEIYEGYIYIADEIVIKGYIIKEYDNRIKYIIIKIKDNNIWIKRHDKWLQSERIKKLTQLGI